MVQKIGLDFFVTQIISVGNSGDLLVEIGNIHDINLVSGFRV